MAGCTGTRRSTSLSDNGSARCRSARTWRATAPTICSTTDSPSSPKTPTSRCRRRFRSPRRATQGKRSAISLGRPSSNSGCRCSCRCSSERGRIKTSRTKASSRRGREKMVRFLIANALLFALFWIAGTGVWFFGVWLVAMATWLSLVTRIRNIAEHACTSTGQDPFSHARTTLANPIERLLIAPYWVNYHAEHHLFMYLPCYRLAEAHRLLVDKGLIGRMEVAPGYLEVMRLATSGRRI